MINAEKQEKTKKGDFVELEFTGYYDGKVFDSTKEEELKKLNPNTKTGEKIEKPLLVIGQNMVVTGLDKALEDKETGKEYEVHVPYKEGFGERKREFVKTIPLHVFTEKKIDPKPGATFIFDNVLARIITISGARVITDFNNPLAGKDIDYKFKIIRIVDNDKEKTEALFKFYFKEIPNYSIKENKIIVRGPREMEPLIEMFKDKFKEILGKELSFSLQEDKKDEIENKAAEAV